MKNRFLGLKRHNLKNLLSLLGTFKLEVPSVMEMPRKFPGNAWIFSQVNEVEANILTNYSKRSKTFLEIPKGTGSTNNLFYGVVPLLLFAVCN
jgi:hypothetical protein